MRRKKKKYSTQHTDRNKDTARDRVQTRDAKRFLEIEFSGKNGELKTCLGRSVAGIPRHLARSLPSMENQGFLRYLLSSSRALSWTKEGVSNMAR